MLLKYAAKIQLFRDITSILSKKISSRPHSHLFCPRRQQKSGDSSIDGFGSWIEGLHFFALWHSALYRDCRSVASVKLELLFLLGYTAGWKLFSSNRENCRIFAIVGGLQKAIDNVALVTCFQ